MKKHRAVLATVILQSLFLLSSAFGDDPRGKERDVKILIEFLPEETKDWSPINDTVMGGVSTSTAEQASESTALFKGILSLENNGGFASIRCRPQPFDLGNYHGVQIRVRGDGNKYRFRIRTDSDFDGPTYQCSFEATAETWSIHEFPFGDFFASSRGRPLDDHPPLDPAKIKSFGFLIADKQEGAFSLEIDWIRAY
jgi:monofunctional biosynthetic peptidoglycan transglycosylase